LQLAACSLQLSSRCLYAFLPSAFSITFAAESTHSKTKNYNIEFGQGKSSRTEMGGNSGRTAVHH
jgi:hypothetical protein